MLTCLLLCKSNIYTDSYLNTINQFPNASSLETQFCPFIPPHYISLTESCDGCKQNF